MWRLACVLIAIGGLARAVSSLVEFHGRVSAGSADFSRFLLTARCLVVGCEPYLPPPDALNLNPPIFHVLVVPVAALPDVAAGAVWTVIGIGLLIWAGRRILAELDIRDLWLVLGLVGVLMLSGCLVHVLRHGQVSLVLLPAVTAFWLALRRDQWTRAAVWLGVLIAVKPFLGLFVVWLFAIGRRREAAIAVALAAVLTVAGVVLFGWHATAGWLWSLTHVVETGSQDNGSLSGLVGRTVGPTVYFQPLLSAPAVIRPVWLALVTLVGIVALARSARAPIDRAVLIVLVAALLISPKGWAHYGVLLLGPLLAVALCPESRALVIAGVVVLLIPRSVQLWGQPSGLLTLTIGSAVAWGYLLLFAAATRSSASKA